MFDNYVAGRLGPRLWGYLPVEPRPISFRPFVHHVLVPPVISRETPRQATCITYKFPYSNNRNSSRPLLVKDGITGEKWPVNLACDSDTHVLHRVLLHDANLQHGTDGFTSPLKEGMLCIFSPKKSDGFRRVQTCDLGYQRPACYPLGHQRCLTIV
jgi:hypothetical protein